MNKITNVLALGVFGVITTEFGIIGILPKISAHYLVSIEDTGVLVSLFAIAVAIAGPVLTISMARFNKKKVILSSILLFIISNILSACSPSFGWLVIARVLPAFLLPVYFSNGLVIAANSVQKKNSMKAIATVYTGLSIATILGIPMTTYIADRFHWKTSFWVIALINTIAFISIYYFIPDTQGNQPSSYKAQLGILRKKPLWLTALTVCLIAAGAFSVYSYFADYLHNVFVMDGSQISIMLLIFGIAGVVGNWFAGITLSKNIYATILMHSIAMGSTFLLLQQANSSVLFQSFIIGFWGFFHMAGFVISQAWISISAPEAPEFANSLVVSVSNLGIAMGASLGGFIIATFGIEYVLWGGILSFSLSSVLVIVTIKLYAKRSFQGIPF
ncbi:MFS transporter [Rapidithrix thailandica]|uniref:MFS transporter n=1 Tax=Rapidithrix thailandica TaxID=413964 RepID=A0AAW9S188_9BACT